MKVNVIRTENACETSVLFLSSNRKVQYHIENQKKIKKTEKTREPKSGTFIFRHENLIKVGNIFVLGKISQNVLQFIKERDRKIKEN